MFYRYEIKNNGSEDILYLYLTMQYEFSKELGNINDIEIKRRTNNFIRNNNINFNGEKVYLVIDGIVVKAFNLDKNDKNIELLKNNLFYGNDIYLVTLELDNGAIIEISLREYLLGAIATNMIPNINIEVIKAMAVLYRTFAFREMSKNKKIKAINNFVVYKPISYYKLYFAPDYDMVVNNLNLAIDDTDCIFLSYKNDYILPFIHITNYGYTLEDSRYSYLSSVSSLWDFSSPYFVASRKIDYNILSRIFKDNINKDVYIKILEISPNGRVLKIRFGSRIYDGVEFSKILNLKSLYLNIIINKDNITFITKGYGEFMGLSIYGANELATNGCNYTNILNYYFPKVKINKYIKELSK